MTTQCSVSTRDAIETYKTSGIESATPGRLVLQTYDFVIAQCRDQDMVRAKQGVVELMSALDLDREDIAGPLFRIYEYCLDALREGRFEETVEIFCELREAWKSVLAEAEMGSAG